MGNDTDRAFAELLRRARRSVGLTQEQLAERAGISARAISDLERGINRGPQLDTLRLLADALELSASERRVWETVRLRMASRGGRAAHRQPDTPRAQRGHLPTPLTSFVGREREVADAAELLRRPNVRLVTLTGVGGVGKTRLAIAVANELVADFPDGVWFVPLSPVREPLFVLSAVADVLGVRETSGQSLIEAVRAWLHNRQALLVMDNFEHVLAATSVVTDLLSMCPGVKILATSRSRLHLSGDFEVLVQPLPLPEADHVGALRETSHHPSIRLFVERAQEVRPDFHLTTTNVETVASICRRLDGLPLAIELAAVWMRMLSPQMLLDRLEERLMLLTGGPRDVANRQRTLRNTIEWSYDLLHPSEQALFRRLSIFAGGWTLEAAEEISDPGDLNFRTTTVLDALTALVDQHLVFRVEQPDGDLRLGMLETIREYGLERLHDHAEVEDVCQRHARYFLMLAEHAERELTGPNQIDRLARLEREHSNLRAALSWLLENNPDDALRLAGSLGLFWYTHGHLREGREWLDRTLTSATTADAWTMARALNGAGWIALFQKDYEAANAVLDRALVLFRGLGDVNGIVSCLANLGFVVMLGERDPTAIPAILEEALALRPAVSDMRTEANLLVLAGLASLAQGDMDQAVSWHEESFSLYQTSRDVQGMTMCMVNLSLMALGRRDFVQAERQFREVLRYSETSDDKNAMLNALNGLAAVASYKEEWVRAAMLWGAAEAVTESTGLRIAPVTYTITHLQDFLDALHDRLDERVLAAAWAEGKALNEDEAITLGLEEKAD